MVAAVIKESTLNKVPERKIEFLQNLQQFSGIIFKLTEEQQLCMITGSFSQVAKAQVWYLRAVPVKKWVKR